MITKKKRVTKDIFRNIMENGKIFYSPFFTFYFLESATPRYSFVAPKKNYKTAVIRNKNRRKGYNILRVINPSNGFGIFFFKKEASKASISDLRLDIEKLLKKHQN